MKISPIFSVSELKNIFNDKNLVILDARVGKNAHENYLQKHIKGARFISLDDDLANVPQDASKGGRHPLPEIFEFAKILSDLGISENSHIVVYDDKSGANAAARCWWMLKSFGIEEVQVLDGGFQQAEKEGVEMNSGEEHIHKSVIKIPVDWKLPTKNILEVEKAIAENSATVIDVRDAYRYNGISEPIDLVAGHIPGAINIPFSENLDENGNFLQPEILKEKYLKFLDASTSLSMLNTRKLIIHCGSGVTACHTILALNAAGFEMPDLYVGSWSEWSRSGREIAVDI